MSPFRKAQPYPDRVSVRRCRHCQKLIHLPVWAYHMEAVHGLKGVS
jgi:hypothetical protein